MSDFHVAAVHYTAAPGEFVLFDSPSPLRGSSSPFAYELADDHLTLTPTTHFASEAEVRSIAETFVRTWEISTGLEHRHPQVRFTFERVEIVDRDPPSDGSVNIAAGGATGSATVSGVIVTVARSYHAPPVDFDLTSDVESLWMRYQQYVQGREPLTGMGYFVLTVIEGFGPGRDKAAQFLKVDVHVLDELGKITSKHGDSLEARKRKGPAQPLTKLQVEWVDATVRMLIRRLAQSHATRALRSVTMADLPQL